MLTKPNVSYQRNYPMTIQTHSLYDHATGRMICVSNWSATINTLHRCGLNYTPNFVALKSTSLFHTDKSPTSTNYWEWLFDPHKNEMIYSPSNFPYDKVEEYSLIAEKAGCMDYVCSVVFAFRRSIQKEFPFQDLAYHYKEREATFIVAGMGVRDTDSFPFVEPYAEIKNISLQDAAKEILVHANLFKHKLADSERIRIKYQELIVKEKDMNNLSSLMYEFDREVHLNGL